jgi:hypothetical protein
MNETREPARSASKGIDVPCLSRGLVTWLLAAWLGAALLFAHGCHGNEDHELFTALARVID